MEKIGFKTCPSDPCLFYRKNELGIVIVVSYVDDNACCGHKAAIEDMLKGLTEHGLTYTKESLTDYLSCEVVFNDDRTKAWLGQPHMIKKIEKVFGEEVQGLQMYSTPGTPGVGLTKPKDGEATIGDEKQSRYRSGVGMLLYLLKSRPDVSNSVRELTKCLTGANPAAYKEMLRVIKFVLDTRSMGLRIEPHPMEGKLVWNLVAYTDSDWAGDKDDRRSISGFILFLNGVPILWRSKSQRVVALSSAEAEFMAASEAIKEVIFVVQVLLFLGIEVEMPVKIRVDNMGAIFMSKNVTSTSRTRHMDTKYRFVNELVDDKLIEIIFVKSEDNYSDGQTKNVTKEVYENHTPKYVAEKNYWKK